MLEGFVVIKGKCWDHFFNDVW